VTETINEWLERRRRGRINIANSKWVYTRHHDPVVLLLNSISPEERTKLYCEITGKKAEEVNTELANRKERGGNHFALYWASINRVIAAHFRQLAWHGREPGHFDVE